MRNILLPALLFFILAGCAKDRGNYNYQQLDGFYVDTINIKQEFIAKQYDTLRLSPKVVYNGDKSRLTYKWTVYDYGNSVTDNPPHIISTSEKLAAPISFLPDKYWLQYTVQDSVTGRTCTFRYIMTVENVGAGIMVLYEKDNKVDCDLIKTKLLTGLLDQDAVSRNLYSTANPGHPLTGNALAINMFKTTLAQFVVIYTDNDGVELSSADMVIAKSFNEQFAGKPDVIHPEGYFCPLGLPSGVNIDYESSTGFHFLVNDGLAYANMISLGLGKPTAYSLLLLNNEEYKAAPFMMFGSGKIIVYDQLKKRFLTAGALSAALTPLTGTNTAYNFQSVGKDMIYASQGYGHFYMYYSVFKNTVDDGKRYIYVTDLSIATSVAKYMWDVSAYPSIANAKLFAFGSRGQLMYYAVNNRIYQIKFDFVTGTLNGSVDAWPNLPADEEITCMKLCPHPGRNLAESAKDKYLFVATYNNTTKKGKVYFLELNVATGAVKTQPAAVYENFGKVKDMAFKF